MNRNNPDIYQHFHGYEELLRRIDDLCDQAQRYRKARLTPFLPSNEVSVVQRYLGNQIDYHCDGGYPQAEYKRIIIGEEDAESEIVCLCARLPKIGEKIEHRDLMGALMNCGLKREQFGDLFIKDQLAVVYTTKESAGYIMDSLRQIRHSNVLFEVSDPIENVVNIREFTKAVSGYRLDAIVGAMCNLSRAKAQEMIRAKLVSVNHEILEETAYLCHNEDTISVRGYGRFKIFETIATTKKDRDLIRFGKYE